jgi:hypothetical protein
MLFSTRMILPNISKTQASLPISANSIARLPLFQIFNCAITLEKMKIVLHRRLPGGGSAKRRRASRERAGRASMPGTFPLFQLHQQTIFRYFDFAITSEKIIGQSQLSRIQEICC